MKKKTFIILLAVLLLVIVLAAIIYPKLSSSYVSENEPQDAVIEAVEDFTVYDTDGNAISLSNQKGTPVIVNFWATWCGYCMDELPAFNDMAEKYGDHVRFMMVDLTDGSRETQKTSMEFIKEQGYTFPVFFDNDQSAVKACGLTSIPVTLFINSEGNISFSQIGAMDKKSLEKNIQSLINDSVQKIEAPEQEAGCSFH